MTSTDLSQASRPTAPTSATRPSRKAKHWPRVSILMSASRRLSSRWRRASQFSAIVMIRSPAQGTMASYPPKVSGRGRGPEETSKRLSTRRRSAPTSDGRGGAGTAMSLEARLDMSSKSRGAVWDVEGRTRPCFRFLWPGPRRPLTKGAPNRRVLSSPLPAPRRRHATRRESRLSLIAQTPLDPGCVGRGL